MECCLLMAIMGYRPLKWGMNLAMCSLFPDLYNQQWCAVDNTTQSPIWKGNDICQCAFSWCTCCTFAVRRLSWASIWIGCICLMSLIAVGSVWSSSGGSIRGSICAGLPKHSWNGVNPVDALIMFIRLNHTVRSAWTQPFWSHSTVNQMHWITVLFIRSLAPSVLGWYAVDIFSFIPVSLCNSFQKLDRKSLSQSYTISRGRPFSQYL